MNNFHLQNDCSSQFNVRKSTRPGDPRIEKKCSERESKARSPDDAGGRRLPMGARELVAGASRTHSPVPADAARALHTVDDARCTPLETPQASAATACGAEHCNYLGAQVGRAICRAYYTGCGVPSTRGLTPRLQHRDTPYNNSKVTRPSRAHPFPSRPKLSDVNADPVRVQCG